jgi:hypothetical protein
MQFLEDFIIEVIKDDSDEKIENLINLSKNGLSYDNGELCGNYADIVRHLFHSRIKDKPMSLKEKDFFRKFVICHKIIIKYNPHLLNNKTYIGQGGATDFIVGLTFLLTSNGYFNSSKNKRPHDDYFDIGYQLFLINKEYIKVTNIEQILDVLSEPSIFENKYQSRVIQIIFEDFHIDELLQEFYNAKNSNIFNVIDQFCELEFKYGHSKEEQLLAYDDFLSNFRIKTELKNIFALKWNKIIFQMYFNQHHVSDNMDSIEYKNHKVVNEDNEDDNDYNEDDDNDDNEDDEYCRYIKNLNFFSKLNDFDASAVEQINLLLNSRDELIQICYYIMGKYCDTLCIMEKCMKGIFRKINFNVINTLVKYNSFILALQIHKSVPENDTDFLQILRIKEISESFSNNPDVIFSTIRRRRTKIIKYFCTHKKDNIKKLKNNEGEDILTFAKKCRGLMHNIIRLLSE